MPNVPGCHMCERIAFIRKIYLILLAQTVWTVIFIFLALNSKFLPAFILNHDYVPKLSIGLYVIIFPIMIAYREIQHLNSVLLILFTVVRAFLFSVMLVWYENLVPTVLLSSFLLVCVQVLLIANGDLLQGTVGMKLAGLISLLCVVVSASLARMAFPYTVLELSTAGAQAIFFAWFIIYDVYKLMHRTRDRNYVGASIEIYMDVVAFIPDLIASGISKLLACVPGPDEEEDY